MTSRQTIAAMRTAISDGNMSEVSSLLDGLDYHEKPTKRHEEVSCLLRYGLTNKEIGEYLKITEATVKVHMKAIFRDLNVNNRGQSALHAYWRWGLPKEGESPSTDLVWNEDITHNSTPERD